MPENKNKKVSGAEAIMMSLLNEGVDTVFGYPGGAIMPAYDALYDYRDRIRHVLVRHEQGASHAAEGYARVTGKPGVCLVTSGPGATNLVTGIADAIMDSVPIVCITGQVHKKALGTDAFQETDVIGITIPITKWNYQITNAEEIPRIFAKAFQIARSGRPGPVLIDITKNAQIDTFDYAYERIESTRSYTIITRPQDSEVDQAASLLNNAKRPFILVGHGVLISRAEEELRLLAEKGDIPVASTLLGLSAFPADHPLFVGMLGMHGNYAPNVLTNEADVILAVGMRFDDRVTGDLASYAKQAKIIHIEIDPAEINKSVQAEVALLSDAKEGLRALLPKLETKQRNEWKDEFKRLTEQEQEKVIEAEVNPQSGEIKMGEVVRLLSEKTKGEAIIVADVGQHQMMAARYYQYMKPDSYIASGGLGTMGFGLPAALGAKLGAPSREVVAIVGDGGFQMTLQELGTIAQEGLPVKTIILNNNFLGMVRQWQELFFDNRYSFVHLDNPDFVKIAEAFRVQAERVENRNDLSAALDRMLKSQKAYLLDIKVENEQNVFPMVPAGASISDIRLE
ncbi:MAG: biosynthetic-type acetolactate synthase large subunit [Deltaproteobacteria bacterium]|nr:biosynthetic-type acetolactate synthase large subunit [Deltaproteobacteria bacterium]